MAVSLSAAPASPLLEWEQTNCPLCRSPRSSTLLQAPDFQSAAGPCFTVVRCRQCSLCFTNPRPGPAGMGRFHPVEYRPHQSLQNAASRTPGRVRSQNVVRQKLKRDQGFRKESKSGVATAEQGRHEVER